jgi:Rrf2 family protein
VRLELTRRSAYAIRAVLALAEASDGTVLSVTRIAEDRRVPVRFLPQVMADLVRAGLVEARVGRTGGYRLRRPAGSISLLDVIEATEGGPWRATCVLRGQSCGSLGDACDVHAVFAAAQAALVAQLAGTTFQDIIDGRATAVLGAALERAPAGAGAQATTLS